MEPIANDLLRAASAGRDRFSEGVVDALAAQTRANGRNLEGAMASVAQRELFTEAVLNAARARFAEIKTVTSK